MLNLPPLGGHPLACAVAAVPVSGLRTSPLSPLVSLSHGAQTVFYKHRPHHVGRAAASAGEAHPQPFVGATGPQLLCSLPKPPAGSRPCWKRREASAARGPNDAHPAVLVPDLGLASLQDREKSVCCFGYFHVATRSDEERRRTGAFCLQTCSAGGSVRTAHLNPSTCDAVRGGFRRAGPLERPLPAARLSAPDSSVWGPAPKGGVLRAESQTRCGSHTRPFVAVGGLPGDEGRGRGRPVAGCPRAKAVLAGKHPRGRLWTTPSATATPGHSPHSPPTCRVTTPTPSPQTSSRRGGRLSSGSRH